MNLPNKLTLGRMVMIPIMIVFLMVDTIPHHYLWALLAFALASFTDYLDGHLARKNHLVTDFGKLMDPLADKLLVTSALVCFVELELTSAILVIIILAREFLVTSIRLVAAGNGKVIAADIWGKAKTVCQMVTIIVIFLLQELLSSGVLAADFPAQLIGDIGMYLSVALTLLSGFNYVWNNREVFQDCK